MTVQDAETLQVIQKNTVSGQRMCSREQWEKQPLVPFNNQWDNIEVLKRDTRFADVH